MQTNVNSETWRVGLIGSMELPVQFPVRTFGYNFFQGGRA
jgi:hypothetical protein